jgi:uncharacterized protein YceH (UPF0502 family)
MLLDSPSQRVLGSLMEKEMTTPENYPLSLNTLIAACNQRSSREPVLDLSEEQVRQAIHQLEAHALVAPNREARVAKYEHRIRTVLNLRRDETAVLCLLLLRGPQTPGELRSRSDRMFPFDDLAAVQSTLERLARRAPAPDAQPSPATEPLVTVLPRQPGSSASRWMHLLGGAPTLEQLEPVATAGPSHHPLSDRVLDLEATVSRLQAELTELRDALQGFMRPTGT